MVVKTATYVPSEVFEEKQFFFENWKWFQPSSDSEKKKNRASNQKVFFRVHTTKIRGSKEMFWGIKISLSKKFYFSVLLFGVGAISLSFCKFLQSGVSNNQSTCGEKKMKKLFFEKLFSSTNFGFWVEKTWTFSKTVRHDSQKRSLHEQMNIFRIIFGSKIICMKVFRHWTEGSDFLRKCFLRVVKGAVHVSSATLWENDDRGRLYFLWLV